MTNDESLQTELQHLINLMAEPDREAWKAYAWAKANALAASNPDVYQALPEMLRAAMSGSSNQPGRERPSTDRKEN